MAQSAGKHATNFNGSSGVIRMPAKQIRVIEDPDLHH
jgi:hypothetical protein